MEELLSTFVRSIFVDNMIFAYYLGMCSFLAVSKERKDCFGIRYGCDVHSDMYVADQLYA